MQVRNYLLSDRNRIIDAGVLPVRSIESFIHNLDVVGCKIRRIDGVVYVCLEGCKAFLGNDSLCCPIDCDKRLNRFILAHGWFRYISFIVLSFFGIKLGGYIKEGLSAGKSVLYDKDMAFARIVDKESGLDIINPTSDQIISFLG